MKDNKQRMFKLWKSNKLTFQGICNHMGLSFEEGMNVLRDLQRTRPWITDDTFAYLIGQEGTMARINEILDKKENVLLVGGHGTGKTTLLNKLKGALKIRMNITGSKLKKKLASAHLTESETAAKVIILDNAEKFQWKSYQTVLKILKDTIIPIVLVTSDLDKIPKGIRSKCFVVSSGVLTDASMEKFVQLKFPDIEVKFAQHVWKACKGNMEQFITNLLYSHISKKVITRKYDTREIISMILTEKDRDHVFKALHMCGFPWFWVIGWLRHNIPKIYDEENAMYWLDVVAWIDVNKFKTKLEYILSVLAYTFQPIDRRIWPQFPDMIKEKKKDEPTTKVAKKTKKSKTSKKAPKRKAKEPVKSKLEEVLDGFDL